MSINQSFFRNIIERLRKQNQQQKYNNLPPDESNKDDYDYNPGFRPSQPIKSHHNGVHDEVESYQSDYDDYGSKRPEPNGADDKYKPDDDTSYFPNSSLQSNMDRFMGNNKSYYLDILNIIIFVLRLRIMVNNQYLDIIFIDF